MAPTSIITFHPAAPRAANVLHGLAKRASLAAAPVVAREAVRLSRRDGLTVTDTQKVTLGIIGAYVVGIAILWNVPYIRMVLWPFKVSSGFPMSFCSGPSRSAWYLPCQTQGPHHD